MKKRIISLVLVGVLTLSILGGCGKKEIPLEESTTESTDELIAEERCTVEISGRRRKAGIRRIGCKSI